MKEVFQRKLSIAFLVAALACLLIVAQHSALWNVDDLDLQHTIRLAQFFSLLEDVGAPLPCDLLHLFDLFVFLKSFHLIKLLLPYCLQLNQVSIDLGVSQVCPTAPVQAS